MDVSIQNGEKAKVSLCSRNHTFESFSGADYLGRRTKKKKLFHHVLRYTNPSKQLSGSIKRTFETIGGDVNSIPFQVSNAASSPIVSSEEHVPKRRKVEDGKTGIKRGRWDKYEHSLFVKGLQIYGRQWKLMDTI